jgi:hypothetical protein
MSATVYRIRAAAANACASFVPIGIWNTDTGEDAIPAAPVVLSGIKFMTWPTASTTLPAARVVIETPVMF